MQAYWHKGIYHEAWSAKHNVAEVDTWEEWDLLATPDIPPDAILVEIMAMYFDSTKGNIGVRKKGSTNARLASVTPDAALIFTVELGVDKIIEVIAPDAFGAEFRVIGYVTM